ncbi:hypothetical protein HJD18_10280 [Thermoleophilia bacterium SCSIO 60948]|nr:hypothetical protein HJD18_10280 [Thermoleophilia bacterium SCSIO 60948]
MTGELDRRAFVKTAAGSGAGLLIAASPAAASRNGALAKRPRLLRDVRFRSGVASGAPASRAMTLWTRVHGAERSGRIELEVARDPDFRRVVERRRIGVGPKRDFTAHARVGGLQPDERYFYRFSSHGRTSDVGRFTTLPADSRRPIRIGFFSCQAWEAGYYTAHRGLAREDDLDLVICLGDYIYERPFYGDGGVRPDRSGKNRDGEVQTLEEYRSKYRLYHRDRALRELRAGVPMMAIWDDHEVEDNYAAGEPGEATLDRRIKFLRRRRNGYRSFYEYMPFDAVADERFRLYRSIRMGRTAELFMLDERRYRDDQACDEQIPCPPSERDAPGRTLLGSKQRRWLERGLERSQARWKIVANQVMAMALDAPSGNPINMDQWDGYGAERARILEGVRDKNIKNVTLLTGDIHTFFAGDVSPTGRQTGIGPVATPEAVATEFVGGSTTSRGILDTIEAESGEPAPPEIQTGLASSAVVASNNPHIKFTDLQRKGYGVLEARSDRLDVDFRSPATVRERRSEVETLASFTVAAGTAAVENR